MTAAQIIDACQAVFRRGTKPMLPEVRPLVRAYYRLPGNVVGGQLHCVLDDHNYERRFIRSCIDRDASPETKNLGHVLLMLSNSQRRRLGYHHYAG